MRSVLSANIKVILCLQGGPNLSLAAIVKAVHVRSQRTRDHLWESNF